MSAPNCKRADAGFALVQALASMVIVGMIGLMILSGVTTGRRVWDRIDVREASAEELDAAQSGLRSRIEESFPALKFDVGATAVDFVGSVDRMTFLANPFQSDRPSPPRRYTLSLNTTGELALSSVSDVAPDEGAKVDRQVLVSGVRQLDVGYFGPVAGDSRRVWRADWRYQATLPEVIRVRLVFDPGDSRQWPDLLIRPRANSNTACRLDPDTHHCRASA